MTQSRSLAAATLLCGLLALTACNVLGPVYGDPLGGEIDVENACDVDLLIAISDIERPSSDDAGLKHVAAGATTGVVTIGSIGLFHVLAVGPTGKEAYWAIPFDEEDPIPVLRIEGDECPG